MPLKSHLLTDWETKHGITLRLTTGDIAPSFTLPSIDGTSFDSKELRGKKYLLSFYRFATCPFCNMRIHSLVKQSPLLAEKLDMVAIFESPLDHLTQHTKEHQAPFPILSDVNKGSYQAYNLEHSFLGMLKGIFFRFPLLLKGMWAGHIPFPIKGSMIRMPADFLIEENGIIRTAYYAKDEGDHISLDCIIQFANE